MGKGDSRGAGRRLIDDEAKAAFIAAVLRGARLPDAAAEAGFTIEGFYGARSRDPAFKTRWVEALEASAGEERTARNNGRRAQTRKMRHVKFTAARQEVFLYHFAGSCDAEAAAEAAGVHASTVYKHRQRDRGFAALFQQALELSYPRLEAEALRARIEAQERLKEGLLPAGEVPAEFDRQLKLLRRWDRRNGEVGPRRVSPPPEPGCSFDEAVEALARRLKALDIPIKYLSPPDGEGAGE